MDLNEARIDFTLQKIKEYWLQVPEQSLGLIVQNAAIHAGSNDSFRVDDATLISNLQERNRNLDNTFETELIKFILSTYRQEHPEFKDAPDEWIMKILDLKFPDED